jgi:hypothetical protein
MRGVCINRIYTNFCIKDAEIRVSTAHHPGSDHRGVHLKWYNSPPALEASPPPPLPHRQAATIMGPLCPPQRAREKISRQAILKLIWQRREREMLWKDWNKKCRSNTKGTVLETLTCTRRESGHLLSLSDSG